MLRISELLDAESGCCAPKSQHKIILAHCEEGIYIGFDSSSIIRYLVPSTGALLHTRFQNCIFEKTMFPHILNPPDTPRLNFSAPKTFPMNHDPRTSLCKTKVQKILHLQALAERLPNGFADSLRVIRLPSPGIGLALLAKTSRKQKAEVIFMDQELCLEPEEESAEAQESLNLEEACQSKEWPQWKAAIHDEYTSLRKHNVFGELVHILTTKPIGHKLIFTKKRDT